MECIFHGHACVEINHNDQSILIDPFITDNPKADWTFEECVKTQPAMVIITHGHADHLWDAIALCKETGAPFVSTYELCLWAQEQWVENTSHHGIWWYVAYDEIWVKFTPAFHGSYTHDAPIPSVAAWVLVYRDDKTLFHAWDSGLTIEYELLGRYESIDCAFLPIGDRFTMGVDDAIHAAGMIKPRYAVPIHFDTRKQIKVDSNAFARGVMLENYAVPKVLRPWQLLVIE